jgi:hypothetical protein
MLHIYIYYIQTLFLRLKPPEKDKIVLDVLVEDALLFFSVGNDRMKAVYVGYTAWYRLINMKSLWHLD